VSDDRLASECRDGLVGRLYSENRPDLVKGRRITAKDQQRLRQLVAESEKPVPPMLVAQVEQVLNELVIRLHSRRG